MNFKDGSTCPVCGQGRIYKEFKQEGFEYKGQKLIKVKMNLIGE